MKQKVRKKIKQEKAAQGLPVPSTALVRTSAGDNGLYPLNDSRHRTKVKKYKQFFQESTADLEDWFGDEKTESKTITVEVTDDTPATLEDKDAARNFKANQRRKRH